MKTDFIPDDKATQSDKNLLLLQHLAGPWFRLKIVEIKRINKQPPEDSGWEVSFN